MTHIFYLLFHGFIDTVIEVGLGLSPIIIIFLILHVTSLKVKRQAFQTIMSGFFITYVGLVLFMQGVHVAFLPVGDYLGRTIGAMENNWILIPLGFLMGFLVAFAEPAVRLMIKQVEDMSSGAIKANVMLAAISIGVAVAVMIAMIRLVTGVSLWWFLAPGYLIVFVLAWFVDPVFVAMAFDNGGVSTGPMCSTFILAMGVGVAEINPGRDPFLDGFGVVSLIALAPIITTMLLSFVYRSRASVAEK